LPPCSLQPTRKKAAAAAASWSAHVYTYLLIDCLEASDLIPVTGKAKGALP
jgi:hypothetical protein